MSPKTTTFLAMEEEYSRSDSINLVSTTFEILCPALRVVFN